MNKFVQQTLSPFEARMRFQFGAFGPLHIREERTHLGLPVPFRILYVSDLHLGHWWTSTVPRQLREAARNADPDLILLGGDLTDHAGALSLLQSTIQSLGEVCPVAAIPGNHDVRAGIAATRKAVLAAGGQWLPDQGIETPLRIDGTIDPLAKQAGILCAHDPSIFPQAVDAGYRFVLAGHLHGGQCVLSNRGEKQYPATWFNRWHGLRFEDRGAHMLVSRGAADTFPFRFNCPREVILWTIS
jgi:predicted MPP superfamily phosphohydrolase